MTPVTQHNISGKPIAESQPVATAVVLHQLVKKSREAFVWGPETGFLNQILLYDPDFVAETRFLICLTPTALLLLQ
ncbi:MAG: hypothetical protein GDA43_10400 [Hormoscilla sp. SP5CHS1]|nr:hypothetical protein [Hormoscilla sp. SP12CHS1]MBC6453568.1 hypothetical protein [Hormoscilla sp. SP5CHS1]